MIVELEQMLAERGAAMVGYADLNGLSADVRENMEFGISIAVALIPTVIAGIRNGPTKEYYAEYKRANMLLNALSAEAAAFLEDRGHQAVAMAATGVGVDPATYSTPLPHKTVAVRAGLGWIGKCALLVTEKFGSAIRINTVLTEAKLPVGQPMNDSRCGDCTACVLACPGSAPSGKEWQPGIDRDAFFDAFACRKATKAIAASKTGINGTFCGMCIAVCPWTEKYIESSSA